MESRLITIDKKVAEHLECLSYAHGVVGSYHATEVLALVGLSTHPNALARRASMYPAHFYQVDGAYYITRMLAEFTLWHYYLHSYGRCLQKGGCYYE